MKKVEALWEKLKNKGLVSNTETKILSLEEKIQKKVNKLSKIERPESREIIYSPVIPIEKRHVKQCIIKVKVKDDWQTYEEKKKIRLENEDLAAFRRELDNRFGKGYNSQRLIILFNSLKNIGFLELNDSKYFELFELKVLTKIYKQKLLKRLTEKLLLYFVGLEENRVLLN